MKRSNLLPLAGAAAAVILSWCAPPAAAVVIGPASDIPNLIVPGNDPGWLNVGRVAGASGVYLGNRWVITAAHVSQGDFRLSDGRVMAASVGSSESLANPGIFSLVGAPDLRMFRLAEDPGLPSLDIAQSSAPVGTSVMMIGAGLDKSPNLVGWVRASTSTSTVSWTPSPFISSNALGYTLGSTSHMRWGTNSIVAAAAFNSTEKTFVIATSFDRLASTFEAQGVSGDSGGGVFDERNGSGNWQLDGLMVSQQTLDDGQPSGTAVYGNRTLIADLSVYRDQILSIINRDEPLWQNQVNHYDIDGSGQVGAHDVLVLVNNYLADGAHALDGTPSSSDFLLDVNGDYNFTLADVNQVISALLNAQANPQTASPLSASSGTLAPIPEPASGVLALVLLGLLAAWKIYRRRR